MMITVSLDGNGDFQSIQAAINALEKNKPMTILIKPGTYYEKLHLEHSNLTIIGENPKTTIITFDDYAKKRLSDQTLTQTFRSYTAFIRGNNLTFENITFKNNAGSGKEVGQAIAAYIDGDCLHFKNCHFIAHQDTLFTAPLPPSPVIPGSFVGPGEHLPRTVGRHYYEECYIQGDIDFIFGSATAYFEKCTIFSNASDGASYITAASTPANEAYGYVFHNCNLVSNAKKQSVFLGRPWRKFAHVVFLNCYLGDHIHPFGWDDWSKEHATLQFYEFQNIGPGADFSKRVDFCKLLSKDESKIYDKGNVLRDWKPY